jgi:hypothetical protein
VAQVTLCPKPVIVVGGLGAQAWRKLSKRRLKDFNGEAEGLYFWAAISAPFGIT